MDESGDAVMTREEKCEIAQAMRCLDDETRDTLIRESRNVIDRRGVFERIARNREIAASYRFMRNPEGNPA